MGGSLVVLGAFGRFHGGRGTLFCQGFLGGPFVKVKILFIRGTFRINSPHTIQPISLVLKLIVVTSEFVKSILFSQPYTYPKIHFCFQKLVLQNKNFINAYILKCNYANLAKMPGKTVQSALSIRSVANILRFYFKDF